MTDRNGKEISIGNRAVILEPKSSLNGRIGEVRGIKQRCPAIRNRPAVRVADGPPDDPNFSAWVEPFNVTVVEEVVK